MICDVVSLLKKTPEDGVSTLPPVKPIRQGRYIFTKVTLKNKNVG